MTYKAFIRFYSEAWKFWLKNGNLVFQMILFLSYFWMCRLLTKQFWFGVHPTRINEFPVFRDKLILAYRIIYTLIKKYNYSCVFINKLQVVQVMNNTLNYDCWINPTFDFDTVSEILINLLNIPLNKTLFSYIKIFITILCQRITNLFMLL